MRATRKAINVSLNLFVILNLQKPVSDETCAKNTKQLLETSTEITDSNLERAAKEVRSITNNNRDIKYTGISFEYT